MIVSDSKVSDNKSDHAYYFEIEYSAPSGYLRKLRKITKKVKEIDQKVQLQNCLLHHNKIKEKKCHEIIFKISGDIHD